MMTTAITGTRLREKTILVTRRAEQARDLVNQIEKEGGLALLFPTIGIEAPESWGECDDAIARLEIYDGILFTSVNAVEAFLQRCHMRGVRDELLSSLKVFAVGVRTRHALEERGLRTSDIPENSSASALGEMLKGVGVSGKRFLLPQGNIARDELRLQLLASGAQVESIVVYRTVMPDRVDTAPVIEGLCNGAIDVITFASPSAITNFVHMIGGDVLAAIPVTTMIAVIGPTTAAAAREAGLRVDITAHESTSAGLVAAIAEHYQ